MGGGPVCLNKTFCRISSRNFSLSGSNNGHYETLNVSRNASRAAIKASFYKVRRDWSFFLLLERVKRKIILVKQEIPSRCQQRLRRKAQVPGSK